MSISMMSMVVISNESMNLSLIEVQVNYKHIELTNLKYVARVYTSCR